MSSVPPTRAERPPLVLPRDGDPPSAPVLLEALATLDDVGTTGFERYEGLRTLGRGGMGDVLLAHDHQIGRPVAIKVSRGEGEHADEALRRFLREARIQGQLDHPAVVPVYDLGVRPDGAVFFTMKRVRGLTLEAVITALRRSEGEIARRFTRRRLLTAFLMVCQAIELAHARGVVHRDLKPGNLMLGDHGEVYVLDWGVASLATDPSPGTSGVRPSLTDASDDDLTITGTFLGTPGYMPPEQAAGHPVDGRADVYALGAVLFEMLTFHPLVPRGERDAVIEQTIAGADARASVRYPERAVPLELEAACVRATAARHADRTPTVAELRGAIEAFLDGDRDVEQRARLADQLAGAADDQLPRALAGERAARVAALQLSARALALAPDHPLAQRTIVRLTLTPPAETPPEVAAAVAENERQTFRMVSRLTAILYLTWLPIGAIVLWMGLRAPVTFACWCALLVAASAVMYAAHRRGRHDARGYFTSFVCSSLAVAATSRLFGPYVLTPTLLTVNTIGFFLHSRPAWRPATVLIAVTAMLAPIVLELTGVVATTTTFSGDQIVIRGAVADYGQPATSIALIGLMVAYAVVIGLTTARLRDRRIADELRVQLGAWQLAQLVPATKELAVSKQVG